MTRKDRVKHGSDYNIESIEMINPAGQTVIKIKQEPADRTNTY
jgi:hypothetical protein